MIFEQIAKKDYSINILIGLIQALFLVALQRLQLDTKLAVPLIDLILTTSITLLLCLKKNNLSNSIFASIVVGIGFFLVSSLFFYNLEVPPSGIRGTQYFFSHLTQIIALYIAIPFIQTWIDKEKFIFARYLL